MFGCVGDRPRPAIAVPWNPGSREESETSAVLGAGRQAGSPVGRVGGAGDVLRSRVVEGR